MEASNLGYETEQEDCIELGDLFDFSLLWDIKHPRIKLYGKRWEKWDAIVKDVGCYYH